MTKGSSQEFVHLANIYTATTVSKHYSRTGGTVVNKQTKFIVCGLTFQ
jgi:hypothetical protein